MSRATLRRAAQLLPAALGIALFGLQARAADRAPRPLWSFHAGAPLSGPPGLGADGSFAIGTVDGYVHAVRPDGVFRYSYTVDGRVVQSPVVLGDGLVLAASDRNRVYAIRPDGSLAWVTNVAGGVQSPLAVDSQERVWLRTGSGTVIAISRRGGVVGFAKVGRAMTLGPLPLERGGVVVASPAGEIGLIGEFGKFRKITAISGPPPFTALRVLGPDFLALRERSSNDDFPSMTRFDSRLRGQWVISEVDTVLCTKPLVTFESGAIRWRSPEGNVVTHAATVDGDLRAPSACSGSSLFAVHDQADIVQVRRAGQVSRIDASGAGLVGLDASRPNTLVAAYRDGRVVALKVVP